MVGEGNLLLFKDGCVEIEKRMLLDCDMETMREAKNNPLLPPPILPVETLKRVDLGPLIVLGDNERNPRFREDGDLGTYFRIFYMGDNDDDEGVERKRVKDIAGAICDLN